MPDRVRESIFSLLRGHTEGANVVDLFSGTGSIGLEAVSRGAARCVLVERDRDVADLLRQNIALLGVEDRCTLVVGDALGPGTLARCPSDIELAFMDPPYPIVREALGWRRVTAQAAALLQRLTPTGFLVLRTPWPLFHEQPDPAAAATEPPASGSDPRRKTPGHERTGKRRQSRRWKFEEHPEVMSEKVEPADDVDDSDDSGDLETGLAEAAPATLRVDVDLKLPGGVGPETHVYHTMAVHLYMREKTAAAAAPR